MATTDPHRVHEHAPGASSQPSRRSREAAGDPPRHAVGRGKGGAGKSTVSVNLGFTPQQIGGWIGLVDADVFGPSILGMLGLSTASRPR